MEKELNNIIALSNPFRNENSQCEPGPSTTLPSHTENFIYEKYLIENYPNQLHIFKGEARQAIKDYLNNQITLCEQDISQSITLEKIYDDIIYRKSHHEEFWKAICSTIFLDPLRVRQQKMITKYRFLLTTLTDRKKPTTGVTPAEILRARDYDIRNLIDFKRYNANCIFHTEDTPSLHYYEKTNSVHCFGCGHNADAIDVYRQINNCSFVEAVRKLQ